MFSNKIPISQEFWIFYIILKKVDNLFIRLNKKFQSKGSKSFDFVQKMFYILFLFFVLYKNVYQDLTIILDRTSLKMLFNLVVLFKCRRILNKDKHYNSQEKKCLLAISNQTSEKEKVISRCSRANNSLGHYQRTSHHGRTDRFEDSCGKICQYRAV